MESAIAFVQRALWVATLLTILFAGIALLFAAPAIDRWERVHAYPFGKMCNSIFTLYEDTCR